MTTLLYTALATTVAAATIGTVWLKQASDRDWAEHCERLRRQRILELAAPITQAFIQFQITIVDRLTPALARAAAAAADIDRPVHAEARRRSRAHSGPLQPRGRHRAHRPSGR